MEQNKVHHVSKQMLDCFKDSFSHTCLKIVFTDCLAKLPRAFDPVTHYHL